MLGGEDHLVCLRRVLAVERELGDGPGRVAIPRARPCEPDEVQLLSGEAMVETWAWGGVAQP